jgi:beta-glucanase (GH16 family)
MGAEFTFNKRYEAPQLWTNFMLLYGKVTIEARVANGTGMISSAVLMSDTFDEIDYEFSGNNFGQAKWASGQGQCNYFGKVCINEVVR